MCAQFHTGSLSVQGYVAALQSDTRFSARGCGGCIRFKQPSQEPKLEVLKVGKWNDAAELSKSIADSSGMLVLLDSGLCSAPTMSYADNHSIPWQARHSVWGHNQTLE